MGIYKMIMGKPMKDRFVKGHIENGLLRANWDYQKYWNK